MKKIYNKIKNHPHTQKILSHKLVRKYEKWVLMIIWAGIIFYLSSKPLEFLPSYSLFGFILRKIAHMFIFAVLTFLIFRILKQTEKRHILWNIFWSFAFAVIYAISDEYHQAFVFGRHGVYTDVLIDTTGILIATWLMYIHYHHAKLQKAKHLP